MAIAQMSKIMIASHRSEAAELLEVLQDNGIVQVLDAEKAMVSKEWPELSVETKRPRDLEEMVARLEKGIVFLKNYATDKGGVSIFQPLVPVDKQKYSEVVGGKEALELLEEVERTAAEIERLNTECENVGGAIETLRPWRQMETPVEEIGQFETVSCMTGLIPSQHFDEVAEELGEFGAAIEQVGAFGTVCACLVACMNDTVIDVQKVLRSGDFEAVSFEGMNGTVEELFRQHQENLDKIRQGLEEAKAKAGELAGERLMLQILFDHYQNLLSREQTRSSVPSTEHTVLLEGWVKRKDYGQLEDMIERFGASAVSEIVPGEGEEIPVEIDNKGVVRPFEVVTRLYGMPAPTDVDPTVFFAPFFALFFGICLTDAAYGLVMLALLWWVIRKIKGDKKFIWMMIICSVMTVIAGALTGGWFGDAIQNFFGEDSAINKLRTSIMWFDPLEKPMYFFMISLVLGYIQIIFGVFLSFIQKLKRKDFASAIFDHLSWLIWLNSLLIFGLAKTGILPAVAGKIFGFISLVPAVTILLFSEREGGWGARIGMGFYNLFSTVFYIGDVLSYIRLMALGMVTAGFGMATNEICRSIMSSEMPVIPYIGAGIVFVLMHSFNIANSALSSFVHTMRLQFVEFFTKFLAGGGKDFEPLRKKYSHIEIVRIRA